MIRLRAVYTMLVVFIYMLPAIAICWLLIWPLGDTTLIDEIEEAMKDVRRDIPVGFKILLTGRMP